MTAEPNVFSSWLAETMRARGLNQSELAQRAGISRAAVNSIVSGRRRAGRDTLCALAKALSVPPEELFRAAGIDTGGDAQQIDLAEWIGLFKAADDSTRNELLDYARYRTERARDKATVED